MIHMVIHNTDKKRFPCSVGKKTCASISNLRAHSQAHKDRQKMSCSKCGRLVINLKSHLETHLDLNERNTVTCKKCYFVFTTSANLQRHMSTVHGSFTCELCKEDLIGQKALRSHLATHKSKPKCVACPKCQIKVVLRSAVGMTHDLRSDL